MIVLMRGLWVAARWPALTREESAAYEAERREAERRRVPANALLGALLVVGFLPLDAAIMPDVFGLSVVLRLGVVLPVVLLLVPLHALALRKRLPVLADLACVAAVMAVQGSFTALTLATTSSTAQVAFIGYFPVLVFFALTLRLGLAWTTSTMVALGVVAALGVLGSRVISPLAKGQVISITATIVVLLLVMVVLREVDLRRSFLLRAGLARRVLERDEAVAALTAANAGLATLSTVDPLTHLLNRRALQSRLDAWDAEGAGGVVAMVDVDRFKAVNDTHGHAAGDECLRAVAGVLARAATDAGGVAARYGGEEFTLLLPGTSPEDAAVVLERLRLAVADADAAGLRVTASIGWAASEAGDGHPVQLLLDRADHAVREAKATGRNRSVRWTTRTPVTLPATPET